MAGAMLLLVLGQTVETAVAQVAEPNAAPVEMRLSLARALSLAASDGFALRAKGLEAQSVSKGEITAGLFPNPTFGYGIGNLNGRSSGIDHNFALGTTIELGGKRGYRIDSARAGTRVAEIELEDTRRQVRADVKAAFVTVLAAQAQLALAAENLKNIDEIERLQRLRASRGDISELELLRIEGQRSSFENDAAAARLALRTAKIQLRQVVAPARIAETYEVEGQLVFRDIMPRPELLTPAAIDQRADVRAARAAIDKANADHDLARAGAWPDIQPAAGITKDHDPANGRTYSVGVAVPLPIFNRNQGEIARTLVDIDRARARSEAVLAQARAEFEAAFTAYSLARDLARQNRDIFLPKAREARDRLDVAYRRGGASLLDFLDAERTLRQASLNTINAYAAFENALTALEAATGQTLD